MAAGPESPTVYSVMDTCIDERLAPVAASVAVMPAGKIRNG